MAIKRPDIYEHNNPDLAIVDSTFVRGGAISVADLTALYALGSKLDQVKQYATRCYVIAEAKFYILVDTVNIGSALGWIEESVSGGAGLYEPLITKATGYAKWTGAAWTFLNETYSLSTHNHDSDYISIVATPTAGNFPVLTAGGELINSVYNASSFAVAAHTHTLSIGNGTISQLTYLTSDILHIAQGTNITLAYDDALNKVTINSTTYALSSIYVAPSGGVYSSIIRLTASDASYSDVKLSTGSNMLISYLSSNEIQFTATDRKVGITDDVTTNATYYLAFSTTVPSTGTGLYVSSTKLSYNPSPCTLR